MKFICATLHMASKQKATNKKKYSKWLIKKYYVGIRMTYHTNYHKSHDSNGHFSSIARSVFFICLFWFFYGFCSAKVYIFLIKMSTKFQLTIELEYYKGECWWWWYWDLWKIGTCREERVLQSLKFYVFWLNFQCKSFTVKNVVKILSVKHFIAACIMTVILW